MTGYASANCVWGAIRRVVWQRRLEGFLQENDFNGAGAAAKVGRCEFGSNFWCYRRPDGWINEDKTGGRGSDGVNERGSREVVIYKSWRGTQRPQSHG